MNSPSRRILTRDIMQGILALVVTALIAVMLLTGRPLPAELWAAWGLIIGFFYGGMGKENGADLHARG